MLSRPFNAILVSLSAVLLALVGTNASARAQTQATTQADRPYRIGIITYAAAGPNSALKGALANLGYQEGDNVIYREWAGDRDPSKMQRYADQLVSWHPDVIISRMTSDLDAVEKATERNHIPVVFWSADPLAAGVIKSYNKPGTNFTGFTYQPFASFLQLRFLKLAIPDLKCVGHLYNPSYAPAPGVLRDLKTAAAIMHLTLKVAKTTRRSDLERSIASFETAGCRAFIVGPHELFNTNGDIIGALALKHHLAAVGIQISVTRGGGLATYGPPLTAGWSAMGKVVDRILKGADPAEIPVDRSLASPLTINVRAARALGISLSPSLIDEANTLLR